MIRAVLFDLDGTLLDRTSTFRTFLTEQFVGFPAVFQKVDKARFVERAMELDENGYADRTSVFARLETELRLPGGSASELLTDFHNRFPETCVPCLDLYETISKLRVRGYALGLITNGSEQRQSRKIGRLGLREMIDEILISEVEGVRKPDAEIFERAINRLGIDSKESVYVGDHPEADVYGASRCGLRAIWVRNPFWSPPPECDAVIDRLSEIPHVIAHW